jgi:hypothetical protein
MVGADRFVRQTQRPLDPCLGPDQVPAAPIVGVVGEAGLLAGGRQGDHDGLVGQVPLASDGDDGGRVAPLYRGESSRRRITRNGEAGGSCGVGTGAVVPGSDERGQQQQRPGEQERNGRDYSRDRGDS